MIQDPANLMSSAKLSLKRIQRKENQSTQELASRIEELEEEVISIVLAVSRDEK